MGHYFAGTFWQVCTAKFRSLHGKFVTNLLDVEKCPLVCKYGMQIGKKSTENLRDKLQINTRTQSISVVIRAA